MLRVPTLQPLGAVELLTARTVPIAAGVRHEMFLPAVSTLVLVATQRRGMTRSDGAKDLPVMDRQTMRLREVRQRGAHDFAQSNGLALTGLRATGHTARGIADYSVWRARGEKAAREKVKEIAQLPIDVLGVDMELALLAATLKAEHNLPYADCFAGA